MQWSLGMSISIASCMLRPGHTLFHQTASISQNALLHQKSCSGQLFLWHPDSNKATSLIQFCHTGLDCRDGSTQSQIAVRTLKGRGDWEWVKLIDQVTWFTGCGIVVDHSRSVVEPGTVQWSNGPMAAWLEVWWDRRALNCLICWTILLMGSIVRTCA